MYIAVILYCRDGEVFSAKAHLDVHITTHSPYKITNLKLACCIVELQIFESCLWLPW